MLFMFFTFSFFLEASVVIISRKPEFDKVLFCEHTLGLCVVKNQMFAYSWGTVKVNVIGSE